MRYILYILLGYLVYRFVTGFLFPVVKTGQQIKKQFDEMQQRMQDANMQPPPGNSSSESPRPSGKSQAGEYIDFEEIT